MAKTPTGETGKTIQLKRTQLDYTDAKVTAEQLTYGEPLYNDSDKTLTIGDEDGTTNANLPVLKAQKRDKLANQIYAYDTSTTRQSSGMATAYTESGNATYIKDKDWTPDGLLIPNTTTYSFTMSDGVPTNITQQSTAFANISTTPCLQQIALTGMRPEYVPTISLYLIDSDTNSIANTKTKQKAFGCISGVYTDTDKLYVVFFKKPASQFRIKVVGG